MEAFETTLTGSDGRIDGIVTHISKEAYHFASLDDALHLTIAKNTDGKWVRLSGSEPYFSGWLDELSESIAAHPAPAKTHKPVVTETKEPVTTKRATTAPSVKKNKPQAEPVKKSTATVAAGKKGKVSSPATKK